MHRLLLLLLGALAGSAAGPASAEIYRCVGADGSVRFVGDPSTCSQAERQPLSRQIQHFERTTAPTPDPGPAAAPPDSRAQPPDQTATRTDAEFASLEDLFLPASAAGGTGQWELVKEAAVEASADPDFVRWGVREKRVLHYTHRNDSGRVRVCSIELWDFDSAGQAHTAEENLSFPNWRFLRSGRVLVMLHAVSRERGAAAASHAIFAECSGLGTRIAARAEGLSR